MVFLITLEYFEGIINLSILLGSAKSMNIMYCRVLSSVLATLATAQVLNFLEYLATIT